MEGGRIMAPIGSGVRESRGGALELANWSWGQEKGVGLGWTRPSNCLHRQLLVSFNIQ